MKFHGNSNRSKRSHHLYEIRDRIDDSVLKYGISAEPVDDDESSKRIRVQLKALNLGAGWIRYHSRILLTDLPGRTAAKVIETQYVEAYAELTGERPRGNN